MTNLSGARRLASQRETRHRCAALLALGVVAGCSTSHDIARARAPTAASPDARNDERVRRDEDTAPADSASAAASSTDNAQPPHTDAEVTPRGSNSPRDAGVARTPQNTAPEPASNAPPCEPTGGGPYVMLEREELAIEIRCATGRDVPAALTIDDLPSGASYDEPTHTLRWTPALDQAAVYELALRGR